MHILFPNLICFKNKVETEAVIQLTAANMHTVFDLINMHCAEVMIRCAFIYRQQKTHVFHIKELRTSCHGHSKFIEKKKQKTNLVCVKGRLTSYHYSFSGDFHWFWFKIPSENRISIQFFNAPAWGINNSYNSIGTTTKQINFIMHVYLRKKKCI